MGQLCSVLENWKFISTNSFSHLCQRISTIVLLHLTTIMLIIVVVVVIVQENMFQIDVEKEKFALKAMNCPGHW